MGHTWKSKPEVFRLAEEVDVGGIEDESGSSEESRSGNEKQACFLFVPACIISSGYQRVSRVMVEPPRPGQRLVSP